MSRQATRQQQMFLVYVRDGGKCAVCRQDVDPEEMATDSFAPAGPWMRELRGVRLVHPSCKPSSRLTSGYSEAA